jgi:cytoskeleton protein RodZ
LSSSLPSLALFVVILLICSGIYSLWQRTRRNVSDHEETTASAPAAQQEPAPVPPPSAPPAAPPESQVAQSQPAGLPAQNPAPPPSAAVEQAPPAGAERASGERPANGSSAAPAAANPPASQATPVPAGGNAQSAIVRATDSANPELRLEVTATEPVWVLAQNNGKYLFSGTLEANQTRTIEADGTVTLRLGNAGGVNILLNGKPVGTVGPRGQVRTVQFTSGGFQIVPVPKPSVPLDDML